MDYKEKVRLISEPPVQVLVIFAADFFWCLQPKYPHSLFLSVFLALVNFLGYVVIVTFLTFTEVKSLNLLCMVMLDFIYSYGACSLTH